ncbi:MAG: hypothetical protein RJA81_1473, partial [Planctomycetota bacterium]
MLKKGGLLTEFNSTYEMEQRHMTENNLSELSLGLIILSDIWNHFSPVFIES